MTLIYYDTRMPILRTGKSLRWRIFKWLIVWCMTHMNNYEYVPNLVTTFFHLYSQWSQKSYFWNISEIFLKVGNGSAIRMCLLVCLRQCQAHGQCTINICWTNSLLMILPAFSLRYYLEKKKKGSKRKSKRKTSLDNFKLVKALWIEHVFTLNRILNYTVQGHLLKHPGPQPIRLMNEERHFIKPSLCWANSNFRHLEMHSFTTCIA